MRKRERKKTGSMSLGDRRKRKVFRFRPSRMKMTHRLPLRPWQQHLHRHRNPLCLILPILPFHPVPLTSLTPVWVSDRGSPHPLRPGVAPSIPTIPLHSRLLLAHKHDRISPPETPLFPSQASQSWVPNYPSLSSRLHPLPPTVTAILTVTWTERDHHTIPLRSFIPPLPLTIPPLRLTTKKRELDSRQRILIPHTSTLTCKSRPIHIHRQRPVPPPFLPLSLPTQRKTGGRTLKWSKENNRIERGKVFY